MNFILLINHPNEKDNKKSIIEIYIEKNKYYVEKYIKS